MKTLRKRVLYPILAVLLLAVGGFIWGSLYFSRAQVLERYLMVRQQEGDMAELVKPYLVWADTSEYLSMDELRSGHFPTLTADQAAALKEQILSSDRNDALYMTTIGSKFWIFPDYRLAMKPLSLTLKTNIPDAQLTLNDRQVAVSDSDNYQVTVDRLPQADYEAGVKGRYQDRAVELTKAYTPGQEVLDLSFSFKTFSVTSNLLDGQVYLDDKALEPLTEGVANFTDLPVTADAQVYVKKTFPDGDLVSDKVNLAQVTEGQELDLSVDGLMAEEEASTKLLAAFDQLLAYYTSGQDGPDLSSLFSGGSTNDFYSLLKTSIATKTRNDSRLATSLAIPSLYVTAIQQIGKASYRVSFGGQYDYYYDKATDPKHRSQGHIYQAISGGFTLEKKGDSYAIAAKGGELNLDAEDNQIKLPLTLKTVAGLPSGLTGTWELRRDDLAGTVYMVFQNGRLKTTVVYDDKTREELNLTISSHQPIGSGLHALKELSGQPEALILDSAPPTVYGLLVAGDQLVVLGWDLPEGSSFDPEAPYQELYRLKKSAGLPKPSSSTSRSSTAASSSSSGTVPEASDSQTEGSEPTEPSQAPASDNQG